jgi:hypothetical protein
MEIMKREGIKAVPPVAPDHPAIPPPAVETRAVPEAPPPAKPGTVSVLLGLFILWQLFFLLASNFLSMATTVRGDTNYQKALPPDAIGVIEQTAPGWLNKEGHLYDFGDLIRKITERWGEFVGQTQSWSLFAPEITTQITFVAVELRWDDPNGKGKGEDQVPHQPEPLLSDNEPRDPRSYFKAGMFRLRKYEGSLDMVLRIWEDETPKKAAKRWGERIKEKVNKEWDTIPAYLKMRYEEFKKKHPDVPPPRQVVLKVRRYSIPDPAHFSEEWYGKVHVVPLARCRVTVSKENGREQLEWNEVEWFNPTKIDNNGNVLAGHYEKTGSDDDD